MNLHKMSEALKELWRFRDLLRQLVRRELKVRYRKSALGFVWSIVPPILELVVYSFCIRRVLKVNAPNYGAYLLCGLIPWTLLTGALLDSSQSLVMNASIIKKVYMPREVVPLALVLSNFIHFMLGWAVYFAGFCVVARFIGMGTPFRLEMLWFPVITLFYLFFVTGLCLFASALNVFYEDVKFIIQTLFRLLLFVLPVLFPSDSIRHVGFIQGRPWLFYLYAVNPVAADIDAYRKTLLDPMPAGSFGMTASPPLLDWRVFAVSCAISVLVLVAGYAFFNRYKWEFVERL